MRINCGVLIALISVLVALLSGFLVHQADVRIISKRADTVKVFIRDTITVYIGSIAQFFARRCDEVQWKGEAIGSFSRGFYGSIQSQTSQTMPSWGLGLFVWYDLSARSFSPIFSYRYRNYIFWIKPVQPYGLGFGLQF